MVSPRVHAHDCVDAETWRITSIHIEYIMVDRKAPSPTRHRPVVLTTRPDVPALEGGTPLPEELTGRASATDESVTELFAEESAAHLADGFRGGSGDDPESDATDQN
jgi:hypothetical protein